jgi:hypothetical protein
MARTHHLSMTSQNTVVMTCAGGCWWLRIRAGGDRTWRELTAMTYHYWTQPIPNPVSYYFHRLPPAVHKFEALAMFAIEVSALFLAPFEWLGEA